MPPRSALPPERRSACCRQEADGFAPGAQPRPQPFRSGLGKHPGRRSQRGVGQSNARQSSNLLGGGSQHLSCNAAVVAKRDVQDFGHFERRLLRQAAQRLLMLLHRRAKLLLRGTWEPGLHFGIRRGICRRLGGSLGFHRPDIVAPRYYATGFPRERESGGPQMGLSCHEISRYNRIQRDLTDPEMVFTNRSSKLFSACQSRRHLPESTWCKRLCRLLGRAPVPSLRRGEFV